MTIDLTAWQENHVETHFLEEILQEIRNSIDVGMCGSPQPEYLFCLSHSLQNQTTIVEIGTCAGHSLFALALSQKMKNGKKVITIDLKRHPMIDEFINRAQIQDWVNIQIGDSSKFARDFNEQIELLWIDGDHRYQEVKKDIESWSKYVIKGGLLALHDYRNGTGVWHAVHETLLATPWIWRMVSDRVYGSIIVFEKIVDNDESIAHWTYESY